MKKILITNKPDLRSLFVNGLILVFKPDHYIDLQQDAFYIYDVFHKDNGDFTFSKANVRHFDVGAHSFVVQGVKILALHKQQNRRFPLAQAIRLGKKYNCEIVFARTNERVFRYQDGILIVGLDSFESNQMLGLSFSVLIHVQAGYFRHASLIRHKEVSVYTGQVQNELIQRVYVPRMRVKEKLNLDRFDDFYIEKQERPQPPVKLSDSTVELAEVHSLQRFIRPDRSVMKINTSPFDSDQESYPISLQNTSHVVSRKPDAPGVKEPSDYYLHPNGPKSIYSIDDLLLEKHWEDEYQKQLLLNQNEKLTADDLLELDVADGLLDHDQSSSVRSTTPLTDQNRFATLVNDEVSSDETDGQISPDDINDQVLSDEVDDEILPDETDDLEGFAPEKDAYSDDDQFAFEPTTSQDHPQTESFNQEQQLSESDSVSYDFQDYETDLDDQEPLLPVENDLNDEESTWDDEAEPFSHQPKIDQPDEDAALKDESLSSSDEPDFAGLSSDLEPGIDPNDEGWVPYEQTPEGSQVDRDDDHFDQLITDWNQDWDQQLAQDEIDVAQESSDPDPNKDQLVSEQEINMSDDQDSEAKSSGEEEDDDQTPDSSEQADSVTTQADQKRPGFFKRLFSRLLNKKKELNNNDIVDESDDINHDQQSQLQAQLLDESSELADQQTRIPSFEHQEPEAVDLSDNFNDYQAQLLDRSDELTNQQFSDQQDLAQDFQHQESEEVNFSDDLDDHQPQLSSQLLDESSELVDEQNLDHGFEYHSSESVDISLAYDHDQATESTDLGSETDDQPSVDPNSPTTLLDDSDQINEDWKLDEPTDQDQVSDFPKQDDLLSSTDLNSFLSDSETDNFIKIPSVDQEYEQPLNDVADQHFDQKDLLVNSDSESDSLSDLLSEVKTNAPTIQEQIPTGFDRQKFNFNDDPLLKNINTTFQEPVDHLPPHSQLVDHKTSVHETDVSYNSVKNQSLKKPPTTVLNTSAPLEKDWTQLDEIGVPIRDQDIDDLSELNHIGTDRLPWFDEAQEDVRFKDQSKLKPIPDDSNILHDSKHPSLDDQELEYQPLPPVKSEFDQEQYEYVNENQLTDAIESQLDQFNLKIPRDNKVQTFEDGLGIYDFENFNQKQLDQNEPLSQSRLVDYRPGIDPVIAYNQDNLGQELELYDQNESLTSQQHIEENDDVHVPLEEIDPSQFDHTPNLQNELGVKVFADPLESDDDPNHDQIITTTLTKQIWSERYELIKQLKINFEDALIVTSEFNQIVDRCSDYIQDHTIWAQQQRSAVNNWEVKVNSHIFVKSIEDQFVNGRFLISNHKLKLINHQLIHFIFKFIKRAVGLLNLLIRQENALKKPRKLMKLNYKIMKRLEKLFRDYQKKYLFE